MSNRKQFLLDFLAGAIGGLLVAFLLLPLAIKLNFLGTANILAKINTGKTVPAKVEEKVVTIPKADYFTEAINKVGPSIVAVQSFVGGSLLRSGSGIVVTRDGLIVTLNSLVPAGTQIIQIIDDGKIYYGKIIYRNFNKNLVILSVSEKSFRPVQFRSEAPTLGQELLAFAKTAKFGRDAPLVAKTFVSQAPDAGGQLKINLAYDPLLFGSAIIDNNGDILGLLDFRNQKSLLVDSKAIEEALYLLADKQQL